MLANDIARVYQTNPPARGPDSRRDVHDTFGCLYRTNRHSRLGHFDIDLGGSLNFRLSGRFVAYERDPGRRSGSGTRVYLRDLRTGRARRSLPVSPIERASPAQGLEVTGRGAAAWIRTVDGVPEVRKLGRGGEVVLDSGVDIDPESLAVSGNRVYWMKAGGPRSAVLE